MLAPSSASHAQCRPLKVEVARNQAKLTSSMKNVLRVGSYSINRLQSCVACGQTSFQCEELERSNGRLTNAKRTRIKMETTDWTFALEFDNNIMLTWPFVIFRQNAATTTTTTASTVPETSLAHEPVDSVTHIHIYLGSVFNWKSPWVL